MGVTPLTETDCSSFNHSNFWKKKLTVTGEINSTHVPNARSGRTLDNQGEKEKADHEHERENASLAGAFAQSGRVVLLEPLALVVHSVHRKAWGMEHQAPPSRT